MVADGLPAGEDAMESFGDEDVLDQRLAELRERRPGFPDRERPFVTLAEATVWCARVRAQAVTLEATATARRPMADVVEEEEQLEERNLDRARDLAPDLEAGLRLARAAGDRELALDSRDPAQDRLADALISILVASDLASARTEELGGEQYVYYVTIDWPALDAFAARIGLPPVTSLLVGHPA